MNTHERLLLPAYWARPSPSSARGLLAELQREVIAGHLLFGVPVRAVAISTGNDDVLFQHVNDPVRFTVVHLTFRGGPEIDAHHPTVGFDGSYAEFLAEQKRIDDWLAGQD
ncbi:hypothetical protein [Hymenobacter terrenus]|uniref:hypothetical protein n=1 Tax=Hymenobacter terrenus TaxID=1629124 RepID=UPI00069853B5|nr:hypothetical protein [Hymenobacter terrenus]